MSNHANLRDVAILAAQQAGALLKQKWEEPRQTTSKGYRDIVTDADYAAQGIITRLIRDRFPTHGFLTEEDDDSLPTDGDIIWIIDPVDGTSNYSRQMHNFSVAIAAAKPVDDRLDVQVGVVFDPMHAETFVAVKNEGATLNGSPLTASTEEQMIGSMLAVDWSHQPQMRQRTLDILGLVAHEVKTIRAVGSAALAISWIAAGRLDAYFNLNLKPWDIAAPQLIAAESGAHISDFAGNPWHWKQTAVLVSNGHLHTPYLNLIQARL